ncbi:MAG: hypothetical protein NTX22_03855 [Ignavibacteriales bacterium]|nr:hypothetical protein [Ignavibacteriales bacterium]
MKISPRLKKASEVAFIILISLWGGCVKENFVEPKDPFEQQQLNPDARVITLGSGKSALTLKTNPENIIETENGIRIKGSLFIANTKYGDMPLSTGDFSLFKDTTRLAKGTSDDFFSGLNGFALTDIPHEGLLKDFKMLGMSAADFGFKKGSEFETGAFQWPVNEDRYYFYYEDANNPLQAELESSSFFNLKKIAIDPTDPFVFFTCDFSGTKLGELKDIGFGVSVQGYLPFVPAVTIGGITGFNGNLFLTGTIPIKKYQVAFTGEACVGFNSGDPQGIRKFFQGKENNFNLGMNGKCTLDNEILDFLNVEVVLGQATLTLSVKESGDTQLKFAGIRETPPSKVSDFLYEIIGQDWDFLDYILPYEQKETFYGTIGNKLSEWELGFKMESSLNLPGDIHLEMGKTQLELTTSHMYFLGQAVVCGFTNIGVEGYADRTGSFKLMGYAKNSFHAKAGKLSIGYDLGMSVSLALVDKVFSFTGEFHFRGEACLGKLCASISVKGSVVIATDGTFTVCFSIGIGKLGFDVCIDFTKENTGNENFIQTMKATEIPLEQVPVENRFPAYEQE